MSWQSEMQRYDIIVSPVQTEQSNHLVTQHNRHTFIVRKTATKPQIKEAIEHIFSVKVVSVNTLIRKGRKKTFRGRSAILSDTKRAIVRLAPDAKIDYVTGG